VDDKLVEILPYGRTREEQAAIDRNRELGRRGLKACLVQLIIVALIMVFAAVMVGRGFD
jgi:hypothetical protein